MEKEPLQQKMDKGEGVSRKYCLIHDEKRISLFIQNISRFLIYYSPPKNSS